MSEEYTLTRSNRQHYISHCHILSKMDIPIEERLASAYTMIEFLRTYVYHFLVKQPNAPIVLPIFESIFSTFPGTHADPIVLVNTVTVQCLILITTIINPNDRHSRFPSSIWSNFTEFTTKLSSHRKTTGGLWECVVCKMENDNFSGACESCYMPKQEDSLSILLQTYKDILNPVINPTIIVIIKFLSIDELISGYLQKVYLAGLPLGMTKPHGNWSTPLEFIEHDLAHAIAFKYNILPLLDIDLVNAFYQYSLMIEDEKTREQIKLILFLLVHESFNSDLKNFFFYRIPGDGEPERSYYNYCYEKISACVSLSSNYSRLMDVYYLAGLIRKFLDKSEFNNVDRIEICLKECVSAYVHHLYMFLNKESKGVKSKRKKSNKSNKKKSKQMNKKRTNKKRRL